MREGVERVDGKKISLYIIMAKKKGRLMRINHAGIAKANKALAIAKQNKKMINKTIENKQDEYKNTNLSVSTSGVRDGAFCNIAQGSL